MKLRFIITCTTSEEESNCIDKFQTHFRLWNKRKALDMNKYVNRIGIKKAV